MKVVADENIPYIREACEGLGECVIANGRKINSDMVKDADCLFVRSVTKVNAELLDGSSVKFVGTATIGFDHIDREYLDKNRIGFTSAPGSNANSVAEYITSAILLLAEKFNFVPSEKAIGIIGVGNVGSRVAKKAEALGMKVLLNDPPRADAEGTDGFVELDKLLAEADIVTVHVPLEREGKYPTYRLAGDEFFKKLKNKAFFINSSRGDVVDEVALAEALDSKKVTQTVLDVWENEPAIDIDMFSRVIAGTPHIAGYSFDGKVAGTTMIVNNARKHFNIEGEWDAAPLLPAPEVAEVEIPDIDDVYVAVTYVVRQCYDVVCDDSNMRQMLQISDKDNRAVFFDKLRKEYPRRREFYNTKVVGKENNPDAYEILVKLGFKS